MLDNRNADQAGLTAMFPPRNPEPKDTKPLVEWKDLLSGRWKGPDPLLTTGRGCACVLPQVLTRHSGSRTD